MKLKFAMLAMWVFVCTNTAIAQDFDWDTAQEQLDNRRYNSLGKSLTTYYNQIRQDTGMANVQDRILAIHYLQRVLDRLGREYHREAGLCTDDLLHEHWNHCPRQQLSCFQCRWVDDWPTLVLIRTEYQTG